MFTFSSKNAHRRGFSFTKSGWWPVVSTLCPFGTWNKRHVVKFIPWFRHCNNMVSWYNQKNCRHHGIVAQTLGCRLVSHLCVPTYFPTWFCAKFVMVCCFRYLESNSQKCQLVSIDLVLRQLHHKNSTNRSPEWLFWHPRHWGLFIFWWCALATMREMKPEIDYLIRQMWVDIRWTLPFQVTLNGEDPQQSDWCNFHVLIMVWLKMFVIRRHIYP